jgi:hypothetical protein
MKAFWIDALERDTTYLVIIGTVAVALAVFLINHDEVHEARCKQLEGVRISATCIKVLDGKIVQVKL